MALKQDEYIADYYTEDIMLPAAVSFSLPSSLDYEPKYNLGSSEDLDTLGQYGENLLNCPDETLDVAEKFAETMENPPPNTFYPVTRFGPPDCGVYAGVYNFAVEVNSRETHKKKFLYSHRLNRIYVDMGCNFVVQFRWDWRRTPHAMYVRATLVFSDDTQAEKRVDRCVQHQHSSHPNDPTNSLVHHVLRSTRALGTEGVYYCGLAERQDSWFSVLVRFPQGADDAARHCSHAYQFACKNSCTNGINRRAIAVMFTLEDAAGNVYGRQSVGARVCACPRRDMVKDEETEGVVRSAKKRVVTASPPEPTKRVRVDAVRDDTVVLLPAGVPIVGPKVLATGLTVMLNMLENQLSYRRDEPIAQELNRSITGIKQELDKLKTP